MGRDGEKTREEILRAAGRMLQTRGFAAFSYGQVAEVLGVKPAAIHYHFPAKADLGVALVRRYRERFRAWTAELDRKSPAERLEGYFGFFEHLAREGRVCVGAVVHAEMSAVPEAVHAEVRELAEETLAWLATVMRDGRKSKVFTFEGRPEDQAALVFGAVQGALLLARSLGFGHFRATIQQLRRELMGS